MRAARAYLLVKAREAGLVIPCERCGTASLSAYNEDRLALALWGACKLDPSPTHLCVPPPPGRPVRPEPHPSLFTSPHVGIPNGVGVDCSCGEVFEQFEEFNEHITDL